jgi:hypothetical protein
LLDRLTVCTRGRAVDVGHGSETLLLADSPEVKHAGVVEVLVKRCRKILDPAGRGDGPVLLTLLDRVEALARLFPERLGKNRAVTESAGTDLPPALDPRDDPALAERLCQQPVVGRGPAASGRHPARRR